MGADSDMSGDAETVFLCSGLTKRFRVASYERDYGEFDQVEDALDFLRLLVLGNPGLVRLTDGEVSTIPRDQEVSA